MHREDVKAAVRKRGTTFEAIAAELGVTPSAVSHVVAGRRTSPRIASHVAKLIGRKASSVWPGRYAEAKR